MKKERIITYLFIILLFGAFLSLFYFFDFKLTGLTIYEQSSQTNFNEGTYNNTQYNGSAVVLVGENLSGTYTSKIFDSGGSSQWNNISWGEVLPTALNTLTISPIYAEDSWGQNISSKVNADDGTDTWERVEVQTWNDTISEGTINSVIGYCDVKWIDAGAQIGFQVSRNNGTSWDSEICLQNVIAHTTFGCDLKTNSGVDTVNEINNLQLRCTFPTAGQSKYPTAGQSKYYSTDWVHVAVNYTSSTDLTLQVCSNNENTNCNSFIGPDKTTSTYYTNYIGENLNVSGNQYFQYKFYFETDDISYTPELQSVSVDYTNLNSPPSWSLIPNQTWDEDTTLTINLSEYSSDSNGDNLTWSFKGVTNISITIEKGISTLVPASNWFGTEYVIFTATDNIESADSNNVTLIVKDIAEPSTEKTSGSGGSGSSYNIYKITSEQASKEYTQEFNLNDKINFGITSEDKTEQHSLTIDNIKNNFVELTIQSEPIKIKLNVGDEKKLNLTSAEYYDLYVKLESIINEKAKITIKTINEEISSTSPIITKAISEKSKEEIKETENKSLKITGAVIGFVKSKIGMVLIFIVLIIVLFVHLKKNNLKVTSRGKKNNLNVIPKEVRARWHTNKNVTSKKKRIKR